MDIKCRIIIPRPEDPQKAKEQGEIVKVLNQISEWDAREADRELKEFIANKEEQERREKETLQEIKDFRKKWEEEIGLDDETKNKIIEATNRIASHLEIEPDGSIRIEMKIGWKEWKILNVSVRAHTDDVYGRTHTDDWMKKDEVKLSWMRWDSVDNWLNQKLKEYVKEKERENFHILTIEQMRVFLDRLWKEAELTKEEDQIAMLMYLTGMYGFYWLSMWDNKKSDSWAHSRSNLSCIFSIRRWFYFNCYDYFYAGLCMIACN